jgi:3-hydroxypropanoate dehydrogenase
MDRMPQETQRPALDAEAMDLLFREARTHNGWLDRPVSDEVLKQAVDLMKFGPTAVNASPMRIVFVRSPEAKAKLKGALMEGNVEKTMAAPATAILGYDRAFYDHLPRLFPHADATDTAYRNGTLQAGYFLLALRGLGLDTGPMTGFDADKVDAAFFAGTSIRSNILVNIGYGDEAKLYPRAPRFACEEIARFA